jgi:hypothetical protein
MDNVEDLETAVLQHAAIVATDGRAYRDHMLASIRDLASMWVKAEVTLGRETPTTAAAAGAAAGADA